MKFDDFLLSNDTSLCDKENYIVKTKYNENIDFLYRATNGKLEFDNDLYFIGMFEKNSQKYYGNIYYLDSIFYECQIFEIKPSIIKKLDVQLNSYVKNNTQELMDLAQKKFDKYISDDTNYTKIKELAVKDYIYQKRPNDFKFSVELPNSDEFMKPLIISYIQNQYEAIKTVFDDYITDKLKNTKDKELTIKEEIGMLLLEKRLEKTLYEEIRCDPQNEYKQKHDIIDAVKKVKAEMLTLTLKHNDKFCSFKYPKSNLCYFHFSDYYIPDTKSRNALKQLYENENKISPDFYIEDIETIEFRNNILYKNNDSINQNKDYLDIVDEMFE